MPRIRDFARIICLFLLVTNIYTKLYTKIKTLKSGNEDEINAKFAKLRAAHEKQMAELTASPNSKPNQDFLNYKRAMHDDIVSRGLYPDQIHNYKNGQGSQNGSLAASIIDRTTSTIESISGQSFLETKALYPTSDNPVYLLGNNFVQNINSLPQSGGAAVTPWSSTYWAMRDGGTSVRYCMNSKNTIGYVNSSTGSYSYYYTYSQSVSMYYQPSEHDTYSRYSNYADYVNAYYSPTEKYDLAVGDYSFTLTNYAKRDGQKYVTNGDVPGWYGYCDGWSSAAFTFRKAMKPVTVTAADGKTQVTFLPNDISALAVQFMAKVGFQTKWIGNRCNGNQSSPTCISLNPGSFVIAIANQMGIKKKALVCDPYNFNQIWNQPMDSYSLRYYNVVSDNFASTPNSAMTTIRQVESCGTSWCQQILQSLSGYSTYVVGVYIQLTYMNEITPTHSTTPDPNATKTIDFDAYLELDSSGNIIGGYWKYTQYHPDFCWLPAGSLTGIADSYVTSYDGSASQNMGSYAAYASQKGQVLKAFLNYLYANSS